MNLETTNIKSHNSNTVYFYEFCNKRGQRNGTVAKRGVSREQFFLSGRNSYVGRMIQKASEDRIDGAIFLRRYAKTTDVHSKNIREILEKQISRSLE